MTCAWCRGPIPAGMRSDAICCSKRCRQARHRFTTGVGTASPVAGGQPRRLAYADPPYPGLSARYYGDHPDFAGEVDHGQLIEQLAADYDAWALSTNASSLQVVLALCPPGVRVAAWHRGERPHQTATGPLSAWEPVIYGGQFRRPARPLDGTRRADPDDVSRGDRGRVARVLRDASCDAGVAQDLDDTWSARRVDSLVYRPGVRTTDPNRVIGAKPAVFCRWIFELLGATVADSFTDVFPGSGGVARAWETYIDVSRSTAAEQAS